MKHHLLSMFAVLALTAQTAVAADVPATRLFTETFNSYTAGNELYDGKTWLQYASNTADPIKVTAKSLEYEGYSTTTGNCVTLSNTATGQDLFCKVPTGKEVKTGSFYASFLLNVSEAPTTNQAYFICFITQTKAGISDKKSSSEFAKLFACGDEADNTKYQLGITRATAVKNVVKADTKLSYGTTYLVVLKYTFVDGNTNDTVELFINPTVGSTEPAASAKYNIETGSDASTSYGLLGVELRQGQTASYNAPLCKIDELHVATSWNGLFDAAGGGDTAKPTIASAMGTNTGLDPMISGTAMKSQALITATDLKGDITITCGKDITCNVATISKDSEYLADGYPLQFTITPTLEATGAWASTVTLSSEGADDLVLNYTCNYVIVPTPVATAAQYRTLYTQDGAFGYYKFTGKLTVTAIEAASDGYSYYIYAQDETGAVMLSTMNMDFDPSSLAVGDQITDFIYMLDDESNSVGVMGVLVQTSETAPVFTKAASGVEVTPLEVSPAEFSAANGQFSLVKLAGVSFSETGNFEAKSYTVTTPDGATAQVHPFAGSDLIGTAIPAKADVVGISKSKSTLVVWPRTLADVTLPKPTIASALGTTSTGLDPMISGTSVSTQIYITATDLKSDVTITCGEGITCPVASISKDEAGLAGAYKVDFTVTPTLETSGAWSSTVTFSSEGAESLVFTISCDNVLVPTQVTSAAQYRNLYTPEDYSCYKFAGKVTVTAIEAVADSYTPYYKVYAQDATGGICLSTEYMTFDPSSLAVGDKITDFLYMYNGEGSIGLMGMLMQTSETAPVFTKAGTGTVTPLEINPADFTAADYQYRLVKLAGVSFSETGNFEAKSYTVTTPDDGAAQVHPFAGSDLIGTAIPAKADVVGISMSKSALVVWPRTLADVTAGAASVNITKQDLYDFKNNPAPVNVKTAVAEFTVVAENLPEAAPIEITGADAAMFSVEPKAVPAGSATTKVTLYYQPTATGKHKGNVIFDFDGINSEFNTAYSVNAMAYDPEHLPTLALDPAEVILTAKVGQKAEASVKLTVANAFDYINAARTNAEVGSIIISSSMFLPTMAESTFKVTFQPKEEGNVEQQFVFTTLKGEPVTLKVKGVTDGGAEPEQPEGGQLVLDDSKPLPYYEQDFANVESNKPLALTGWCNVAEEGTRAWWGYVGDDFKAAKATAYDSKVAPGAGTPCQMLLVTPALDYKNTTDKHVKFSVMGKALIEGMTDKLEICLIEKEGNNTIISPMNGFPIPAIPDEADQWVPIDADMSAIPSMPDVFWIGFRFTSTRGRDNAAQYFIKDFKWSSKGSGISSILADANGLYTVFNLQGILLMKDADLDAVRALAPGFYIVNGRKVRL